MGYKITVEGKNGKKTVTVPEASVEHVSEAMRIAAQRYMGSRSKKLSIYTGGNMPGSKGSQHARISRSCDDGGWDLLEQVYVEWSLV